MLFAGFYTSLQILSTAILMMGAISGIYFLFIWRKDRERIRHSEEVKLMREMAMKENELNLAQEIKLNLEKDNSIRNQQTNELNHNTEELLSKLKESAEQQIIGVGSGGFIILELPEEQRSIFHDLLKGFEDYAKLRGYTIYFSVDNSVPHKIAFKFTIGENGVSVSTQTVRKDIKDYIDKIKNGDVLDDLPVIIEPSEHNLVLTTMKNRLSFLQHNFNLQHNSIQFYENFLKNLANSPYGIMHQQSVIVQAGNQNRANHCLASNSPKAIVGENNTQEDNSDNSIITIANSFNEKKEQIDKLGELIALLKNEEDIDKNKQQTAVLNLEKIKEELEEESEPDRSNITKWLIKTKNALDGLVLTYHTNEAIRWIYDSFNFLKSIF
ncbi:MAG: hypothetical protein ACYDGO_06330 [Smithellaceae bacterium]